jgi:hypothetical protein
MVKIDMTKEGDDMLVGVHLWDVTAAFEKPSSKGAPMLVLELRCGEVKLTDYLMLSGYGWTFTKNKLRALDVPHDYSGEIDPVKFINKRVWVATHVSEREGVDRKTGEKRKFRNLAVDTEQLRFSGYNHESDVPAGCTMPESNTPF